MGFTGSVSIPGALAAAVLAASAAFSGTVANPVSGDLAATSAPQQAAFSGAESFTGTLASTTTVAESALQLPGYAELMDQAIARADQIHARVGYEHGPQVPDPRLGKGLRWTERFEAWWDRIIEARRAEGRAFLTINPEFGPPSYQPVDPRTGEPLADIWDVCLWITRRFRERWAERL